MTAVGIINLLAWAAQAAIAGQQIAQVVRATRASLDAMVDTDRDPTKAEWDAALAATADLHDRIQNT